jgi:hypothetical protein
MSIKNNGSYNLLTESEETRKEIEIRGRILMMACDIEYCLLNIIAFCSPDPYNHERAGQFHSMRMKNKIDNAIRDMKNHNIAYYLEFESSFNNLEKFREVRNDMAHYKGDFPLSPNLSIFKMVYVDKDQITNVEGIKAKVYSESELIENYNLFAVTNARLSSLWFRLKNEFDSKNSPLLYNASGKSKS